MASLRTALSSSRAAIASALARGTRGLTKAAQSFGGIAAHLRIEMAQRFAEGWDGLVGRFSHLPEGFDSQRNDAIILILECLHQMWNRRVGRGLSNLA